MGSTTAWLAPVELEPPTPNITPKPQPPVLLPTPSEHQQAEPSPTEIASLPTPTPSKSFYSRDKDLSKKKSLTNRPLLWLTGSVSLLLVALILQNTFLFLQQQWQTHTLLGLFYSVVTLVLSTAILALIGREVTRLRQLRTLTALRQESLHHIDCQTFGSGLPLVNRIIQLYQERAELAVGLQHFHDHVDDYLGDREILSLFSTHVMSEIDSQAYQVVVRHASAAALMTAISPMAWLDAVLFLWRNVWMVREIAELYGARPGASGSLVLLRQAARGMMSAGVTDILANSASSSMGHSLATVVMAKAGQGLSNGLFMARIGLQTLQYCRPLPFSPEQQPGLGHIRKALQQAIKESTRSTEQTLNVS